MPYYIRTFESVLLAGTRSDQTHSTSISQATQPNTRTTTSLTDSVSPRVFLAILSLSPSSPPLVQ